ncbi:MAG TPA: acetyl-CoA carboxylase biotin carboxyl carrier protein [Phycisphaerales bacterium]|nr:acetyl-CoA carboxylase biotin carboxyl carrier protein [Phycisphaerales bacterium]
MIDISKLKELVALMAEHDLSEVDLKDEKESISLKRGTTQVVHAAPQVQYAAAPQAAPVSAPAPAASGGGSSGSAAPAAAAGPTIDSPMVGTLYLAPNPDSPPFVKPGQQVTPDTTVCLIEAMKVFNEIKAEKSGTIEQILVKSGQAVEFGQKLFAIRPS